MAKDTISAEDMLFHALYIGSTGAGKTNALLYWLLSLFRRKDVALVLIDPHGDAAFDLVRTIPESERGRVALIDPESVTFGLNPLSLPEGTQITNRVQIMQTQVEELSALLSDVLNTDASTAPRLMWVFKGVRAAHPGRGSNTNTGRRIRVLDKLRGRISTSSLRMGRGAARIMPSPTSWTATGLFFSLLAAYFFSVGHPLDSFVAGLMVLVSGFFDILDGAVARATNSISKRGAFLDSTMDRVGEASNLPWDTPRELDGPRRGPHCPRGEPAGKLTPEPRRTRSP